MGRKRTYEHLHESLLETRERQRGVEVGVGEGRSEGGERGNLVVLVKKKL